MLCFKTSCDCDHMIVFQSLASLIHIALSYRWTGLCSCSHLHNISSVYTTFSLSSQHDLCNRYKGAVIVFWEPLEKGTCGLHSMQPLLCPSHWFFLVKRQLFLPLCLFGLICRFFLLWCWCEDVCRPSMHTISHVMTQSSCQAEPGCWERLLFSNNVLELIK